MLQLHVLEASTIIRQTWPELPDGVSYPYIQMQSPGQNNQGPFMAFTINAPAIPILIQQYAEEHIKTRLAHLPEFIRLILAGATPMEWRLEYDSEQLHTLGISTDDIRQAVRLHYQKEFLGTYDMEQGSGQAMDQVWRWFPNIITGTLMRNGYR